MQIHNYSTKQVIGEGGMATVYLAGDDKFKSLVAVKVLKKEFVHNEHIRKRFLAEARSMYRMSHPNIIKVTDLIDDGNMVVFVMEYIEGQTLKEYMNAKGKLSDEEIKKLFVQMLDAVVYVHEQSLVHRDIKPSNFMLDKNGRIKLMDFGIAKNMDVNSSEYTITGTTQSMGTPMYMSLEQIKSTKEVTHQTDIYSLGVVLWQMVTGRKPYDRNELSLPEIQVSILKEDLPLTKTNWDDIIKSAMQKSVDLRYKECALMKEDVLQYKTQSIKIPKENDLDQRTVVEIVSTEIKQTKKASHVDYKHTSQSSSKAEKFGYFLGRHFQYILALLVIVLIIILVAYSFNFFRIFFFEYLLFEIIYHISLRSFNFLSYDQNSWQRSQL